MPPPMLLEPPLVKKKRSHKNRNEKLRKVTEAGDYIFNNECIAQEKSRGGGRFGPTDKNRVKGLPYKGVLVGTPGGDYPPPAT